MPIKCVERNQSRMRQSPSVCMGILGVLTILLVVGGCQKTALRANDTRNQFDRYDQARNQRAQPFLEDEFGRRTPNLSERLLERTD